MKSRAIQGTALAAMIAGWGGGALLSGPILARTEQAGLRYTDVAVEGAPPWVAIGTAIGALRGIIVDILWIKVDLMKSRGLYYEVMADAELITRLQPRFAQVWAFHGHNMAYNISVATHTQQERWEWVNAGIRLVRNEGLRHNPNDLVLHKELAFWFAHKIEGYADDAHLYYKRQFAREWHYLLGEPPIEYPERVEWIKRIADAPATLDEAERRTPGVKALIARLEEKLGPFDDGFTFEPTSDLLMMYGEWKAIHEQSEAAKLLGVEQTARERFPWFGAFGEVVADPAVQEQWETLVLWVRKHVLIEEYNMSPQLMYEFTRDLGPLDWRHGQSHALYWSRRGSMYGESRVTDPDDIYKIINNDRIQLQALQDLARYGRITFDPFSTEIPSRFAEPRWIDTIEEQFEYYYTKHSDTRGGGGDTFATFLENFMSSAIREAYRAGEIDRAKRLLARMDERFGFRYGERIHNTYNVDLDLFVRKQIREQLDFQPHLAPSEAVAALRQGFRTGIGRDQPEVYDSAVKYAKEVIAFIREHSDYSFGTKFGELRMGDLLAPLGSTAPEAFFQLMIDPGVPMAERATIWRKADRHDPFLRLYVYDTLAPILERQLAEHELSERFAFGELFPEPPGLAQFRAQEAEREAERLKREENQQRDDAEKRS